MQRTFLRRYRRLREPRFRVTERGAGARVAVLLREFEFRMRAWQLHRTHRIHGVTLPGLDAAGKVSRYRDYWSAAEERCGKPPCVGPMVCGLKRYTM